MPAGRLCCRPLRPSPSHPPFGQDSSGPIPLPPAPDHRVDPNVRSDSLSSSESSNASALLPPKPPAVESPAGGSAEWLVERHSVWLETRQNSSSLHESHGSKAALGAVSEERGHTTPVLPQSRKVVPRLPNAAAGLQRLFHVNPGFVLSVARFKTVQPDSRTQHSLQGTAKTNRPFTPF